MYTSTHTHIHTQDAPMHTYTRVHIGKQGIYRLHDQYGGQTHRHPPGEGQLDLRNFVLPSILPSTFFQQTRRCHVRMASRRLDFGESQHTTEMRILFNGAHPRTEITRNGSVSREQWNDVLPFCLVRNFFSRTFCTVEGSEGSLLDLSRERRRAGEEGGGEGGGRSK